jgi:phosphatidylglycerophosphatase A
MNGSREREWGRPLLASALGLGHVPGMPGTAGALLGPALYLPLAWAVPAEPWQTGLVGLVFLFWCGATVALGGWAERYYGRKDCPHFVTDEVAGFLGTVLLFRLPGQPLLTVLLAFPVTRVIDILKVPPARQLERLPRGWGVLADDLLASVYAAGVLHLVRWGLGDRLPGEAASVSDFLSECVCRVAI